jgi:hypothetical protein
MTTAFKLSISTTKLTEVVCNKTCGKKMHVNFTYLTEVEFCRLVALDLPMHTLSGHIHHDAKLPEQMYSVQQVLKYMLHQVQLDLQETLKLLATDLLRLGAIWKLSAPNDGGMISKLKQQ